jgi:tetratricopeptide (TPR) repeat protein
MMHRDTEAVNQLNLALAMESEFAPALIEKAKVMLRQGQWGQAMDSVQRVLEREPEHIQVWRKSSRRAPHLGFDDDWYSLFAQGQRIAALEKAVRRSDPSSLCDDLKTLLSTIDRIEPTNAREYHLSSQLFARFAAGNSELLSVTTSMMRRALEIAPENAAYHIELAHQYRQQQQVRERGPVARPSRRI